MLLHFFILCLLLKSLTNIYKIFNFYINLIKYINIKLILSNDYNKHLINYNSSNILLNKFRFENLNITEINCSVKSFISFTACS